METRAFRTVTSVAMLCTMLSAILSLIGIAVTGFYPGILALVLINVIPIGSKLYARSKQRRAEGSNHHAGLLFLNLLAIVVVLWMGFVIVHDRVLHDCC